MCGGACWLRKNLFSSPANSIVTVVYAAVLLYGAWCLFDWAVVNATWQGANQKDCVEGGACWTYVRLHFGLLIYGRFPIDERWRVNAAAILLALFLTPVLMERTRHRALAVLGLFGVFPLIAMALLMGGLPGLPRVTTDQWGGLMLNLILAFSGISLALLAGIFLALGRRSQLPVLRYSAVAFIEFWRGVPLLTVLFTALILLPLFLPDGTRLNIFARALVALAIFYAAYMAEVIRAGLQALPRGQFEAAQALGLGYWRTMGLVILPQAFRLVIPGIVNTMIQLFKDTSLVATIGLLDLLGMVRRSLSNADWLGLSTEAYLFAAVIFFICCSSMSRYSQHLERRLARDRGH